MTGWLKNPGFPPARANVDTPSPLYDRAEVESWLRENKRGRFRQPAASVQPSAAFTLMDLLRGRLSTNASIEVIGACLALDHLLRSATGGPITHGPAKGLDLSNTLEIPPSSLRDITDGHSGIAAWTDLIVQRCPDLRGALAPLLLDDRNDLAEPEIVTALGKAIADLAPSAYAQVYDEILDVDARITGQYTENTGLTQLFVDLLPTDSEIVVDPASGFGKILLAAGEVYPGLRLVGTDISPEAVAVATRRAILRDRDIELHIGNSLGRGPLHGFTADAVVTNPPWGLQNTEDVVDLSDPRWVFGKPTQRDNGVWLQNAISHLADRGRAFVLTPRGDLFKSGRTAQWRDEMLRRGAIEAIIGLPAGMLAPYTSISSALWILTKPGQSADPERVLLAEVPSVENRGAIDISEIVAIYKQWVRTREIGDADRAVALTVRELLEPGAGLDPATWLAKQSVIDPQEQLAKVHELAVRLTDIVVDTGFAADLPLVAARRDVRRQRLSSLAVVHRGVLLRLNRDAKSESADQYKVLTPHALKELRTGGCFDVTHVDVHRVRRPVLTAAGDIYVCATGVSGAREIQATILKEEEAGWLAPATVYLVRVDPAVADPWYILTCIRGAAGRYFSNTSSVTGRLDVPKIIIPLLPLAEQKGIGAVMRQLNETTDALARQAATAAALTARFSDAIATRSLTVKPTA
ncbi:N-6 DNA methylase [Gordonia polyisoprenivorans]|uniref:N-6 DNA methylase n=1 Tax=Gordonia polyisoprenivorans TaxID=84595 RepID=UPI0018CB788C|nr:N-6 DNA methylase [Gordonia polyisoprenivorans]